jgi:hypothetical protein
MRKENNPLTTLGAVLLTFKPHIGALILLSLLTHLIINRSSFGKRALRSILIAGIFLFIVGFIADPAWIISYPKMLLSYQDEGNVSSCSECASLPVWLSRWFIDGSLSTAAMLAVVLLILLIIVFYFVRSALTSYDWLLTSALLVTLLVSPYLYNYDFLLLIVPFAVLISSTRNILEQIVVIICYLIPTFAIAFFGRHGNISLLIVTILITFLFHLRMLRMKNPVIDFPASTA